ncbi:MAG: hypothetical protein KDA60_01735 [Planctomycetales bacterium]|nr:hypothetical protein [Planctomycetales bacterium]
MSDERLIPPTLLFTFSVPCLHIPEIWNADLELPEQYRLPSFGELDGRELFADVRLGWNDQGLAVSARVSGKKKAAWCRQSRLTDSDGLSLLIDSRNTRQIHRASRFCHRFVLLPHGHGRNLQQPVVELEPIQRALANPLNPKPQSTKIRAEKRIDGYILRAAISADAITGYDPSESRELGFSYVVLDQELGWQSFNTGPDFPIFADPSLWGMLELID